MGYDATYDDSLAHHTLARLARAEARVLVTRGRSLASRRGLRTVLIRSQDLEEQLKEVERAVGQPTGALFSRCSVCNGVLEEATPEQVARLVPAYVLKSQRTFRLCSSCNRVYWPGTHFQHIRSRIESLTGDKSSDPGAL